MTKSRNGRAYLLRTYLAACYLKVRYLRLVLLCGAFGGGYGVEGP